jgi:hypothetical protein
MSRTPIEIADPIKIIAKNLQLTYSSDDLRSSGKAIFSLLTSLNYRGVQNLQLSDEINHWIDEGIGSVKKTLVALSSLNSFEDYIKGLSEHIFIRSNAFRGLRSEDNRLIPLQPTNLNKELNHLVNTGIASTLRFIFTQAIIHKNVITGINGKRLDRNPKLKAVADANMASVFADIKPLANSIFTEVADRIQRSFALGADYSLNMFNLKIILSRIPYLEKIETGLTSVSSFESITEYKNALSGISGSSNNQSLESLTLRLMIRDSDTCIVSYLQLWKGAPLKANQLQLTDLHRCTQLIIDSCNIAISEGDARKLYLTRRGDMTEIATIIENVNILTENTNIANSHHPSRIIGFACFHPKIFTMQPDHFNDHTNIKKITKMLTDYISGSSEGVITWTAGTTPKSFYRFTEAKLEKSGLSLPETNEITESGIDTARILKIKEKFGEEVYLKALLIIARISRIRRYINEGGNYKRPAISAAMELVKKRSGLNTVMAESFGDVDTVRSLTTDMKHRLIAANRLSKLSEFFSYIDNTKDSNPYAILEIEFNRDLDFSSVLKDSNHRLKFSGLIPIAVSVGDSSAESKYERKLLSNFIENVSSLDGCGAYEVDIFSDKCFFTLNIDNNTIKVNKEILEKIITRVAFDLAYYNFRDQLTKDIPDAISSFNQPRFTDFRQAVAIASIYGIMLCNEFFANHDSTVPLSLFSIVEGIRYNFAEFYKVESSAGLMSLVRNDRSDIDIADITSNPNDYIETLDFFETIHAKIDNLTVDELKELITTLSSLVKVDPKYAIFLQGLSILKEFTPETITEKNLVEWRTIAKDWVGNIEICSPYSPLDTTITKQVAEKLNLTGITSETIGLYVVVTHLLISPEE